MNYGDSIFNQIDAKDIYWSENSEYLTGNLKTTKMNKSNQSRGYTSPLIDQLLSEISPLQMEKQKSRC